MVNHTKIYILFLAMTILCLPVMAQKKDLELGRAEYDAMHYFNAVQSFQKALYKLNKGTDEYQYATFMLGESYWKMNQQEQAEPYYKELLGTRYCDTVPVIYVRYAEILRTKGDIGGAKENYKKYLEYNPDDKEARTGLQSCEWITSSDKARAQVNIEPMSKVNSKDDDFAPAFLNANHSEIIFTSNRMKDKAKSTDQWTGAGFSDLLTCKKDGDGWQSPDLVEYQGLINSDIHEGTPSLNGDHSIMYFTRCDKMADKKAYCQIWNTKKLESRWATPRLVLQDTTANVGQPSISDDELTMYFASDRKGTLGGKDLWVVRRASRDEKFGQPENLGNIINTTGDEVFPYLFNDTTLYFSSNGYKGYGGWDLYVTIRRNGAWTEPVNLPAPFNSGYDDFGLLLVKPGEEGFLTSNRPGGKGGDDLYQFTRKTLYFTISGQVNDFASNLPMKEVQVTLKGDDGSTAETTTDKQGRFGFDKSQVLEDHNYELTFRKPNYFAKKETTTTWPYDDNAEITVNTAIEPIPEKPIVLPEILYDLDKWDLKPQYQDSLTNLVALLKDNSNIVIELRSHTDTRGSDQYNDVLSQKRAQSVVDFIISQGIDPRRLVAKGYGEKVPRVLDKDVVRENYKFKAGTELNDKFVNSLPTEQVKEAAYQLNRRTEFSVLSKDFKP